MLLIRESYRLRSRVEPIQLAWDVRLGGTYRPREETPFAIACPIVESDVTDMPLGRTLLMYASFLVSGSIKAKPCAAAHANLKHVSEEYSILRADNTYAATVFT